jgi:hypothetical protein
MLRIMVTGCRDWTDRQTIEDALGQIWGPKTLIHGDARGADRIAADIARMWTWPVEAYPADWEQHGFAAGPIRNKFMIEQGNPDLVYAFWDGKSKGTLDAIRKAVSARIPVEIYPPGWRRNV